ncbi:MAG: hypothetical protein H7068_12630 [Pedobacter sp.]|nr:hypothetical protein [Chitinophagaceae bacterium]
MKAKILLLLVLISCNTTKSENNTEDSSKIVGNTTQLVKNEQQSTCRLKEKVLGIWADGSSENASFEIRLDSIYYVDHFASYKYKIIDSTITIHYPDFVSVAKLTFIKDTMVMESDGEKTKFWKFKN